MSNYFKAILHNQITFAAYYMLGKFQYYILHILKLCKGLKKKYILVQK